MIFNTKKLLSFLYILCYNNFLFVGKGNSFMQDIYNLDINLVNQLVGIDPVLNANWQEILDGIIP